MEEKDANRISWFIVILFAISGYVGGGTLYRMFGSPYDGGMGYFFAGLVGCLITQAALNIILNNKPGLITPIIKFFTGGLHE